MDIKNKLNMKKIKQEQDIDKMSLKSKITETKNEWKEAKKNIFEHRSFLPFITFGQFVQLYKMTAETILLKQGRNIEYKIDKFNKDTIFFFYNYLQKKGNPVDRQKGVLILGDIGTGKTLMLNTVLNLVEKFSRKIVTRLHSKELADAIKKAEGGKQYYRYRPMFIDDIGKETKEEMNFGSAFNPIPDLFALRFESGAWTFGTCNYTSDDLINFYGRSIFDRMNSMFNIITLTGETRRK